MKWWVVLACCLASGVRAEVFPAKVLAVFDGDTILVSRECASEKPHSANPPESHACKRGKREKIRLANIDAPEKAQPYGRQSRQSLLELVGGKQVQIDNRAVDQYGRIVGLVLLAGIEINQEQLRRGMAWEYSHHHGDQRYIDLENEARSARRGLWAESDPQAPWQWRKQHPWPITGQKTPAMQGVPVMLYDMECGKKRRCAEMASCDEARFYLTRCGIQSLDGDHDGEPCKSLCAENK